MIELLEEYGESIIDVFASIVTLGLFTTLLSDSPAGILRDYIIYILELAR